MADADQLTYILSGDSFESLSFKPLDWPLTLYAFIYSFGSIEKVQLKTGVKKEKKSFNPRLQFQFLISIFNLSFQFHFNFKFQFQISNFRFQFHFSISIFDFNFKFQFQISNFNFNFQISIFSKNLTSIWWHWKFVKNSFFTEFWNPISASVRPKPEFENLNSDSFETNPKFRENR